MATLKLHKNSLIIAYNNCVTFLESDKSWKYEIPSNCSYESGKLKKYFSDEEDENQEENEKKNQKKSNNESLEIINIEVSGDLIAFTTNDKSLFLLEIQQSELKHLSKRRISRTSSCLKFSLDNKLLFVSDKSGDCYVYSCDEYKLPGKWVFGHISQILDLLVPADLSLIVTSDRDEKIRVTNYPETHEIETFCLGHTEFVSAIECMPHNLDVLLSLSGDKTLKYWNYRTGKQIASFDLPELATKMVIQKINECHSIGALLCYEPHKILICKFGDSSFEVAEEIELEQNMTIISLLMDQGQILYVSILNKENGKISVQKYENFQMVKEIFHEDTKIQHSDAISTLFKKRFDNIKDYHERKRKRIEEKTKK